MDTYCADYYNDYNDYKTCLFHPNVPFQIPIEQNRCAMACQGCGAVFKFWPPVNKKQWKNLPQYGIVKLPHKTIKYGDLHCL